MSRKVMRVRLDFDWPIGKVWPGYLASICQDQMEYCLGKDVPHNELCNQCRHAAHLAGVEMANHRCPEWSRSPLPGEGWQMWETCSEGSPMSPVFDTPEKLAQWLADTRASSFGSMTSTYEEWLKMIKGPGWSPSAFMSSEKGFISGVEFISKEGKIMPPSLPSIASAILTELRTGHVGRDRAIKRKALLDQLRFADPLISDRTMRRAIEYYAPHVCACREGYFLPKTDAEVTKSVRYIDRKIHGLFERRRAILGSTPKIGPKQLELRP
jgi:hypothetical protein